MLLTDIVPKLPMRNKAATRDFYINKLGFSEIADYGDYLMIEKGRIEIHFFKFEALDPHQNYGQVYIRVHDIDNLYHSWMAQGVGIHPNGSLEYKPWGQKEFALLDPDHNLLTLGESM